MNYVKPRMSYSGILDIVAIDVPPVPSPDTDRSVLSFFTNGANVFTAVRLKRGM